jgi:hypothetical protein
MRSSIAAVSTPSPAIDHLLLAAMIADLAYFLNNRLAYQTEHLKANLERSAKIQEAHLDSVLNSKEPRLPALDANSIVAYGIGFRGGGFSRLGVSVIFDR